MTFDQNLQYWQVIGHAELTRQPHFQTQVQRPCLGAASSASHRSIIQQNHHHGAAQYPLMPLLTCQWPPRRASGRRGYPHVEGERLSAGVVVGGVAF